MSSAAATTHDEALPAAPRRFDRIAGGLDEIGELGRFAVQALRALPGTLQYASEVLRQTAKIAVGTAPLMFVMQGFIGISVINFAYFFLRTIGASDYTGLVLGIADPRVVTPLMFGYVFASRVCGGVAAELGAMAINQEISAYESVGVDPMQYLVGTRILAAMAFVPIATAISLVGVLAGGYLETVVIIHGIPGASLLSVTYSIQGLGDQLFALVNVAAIALVTIVVACFYGLRTSGGPAAVGSAVARSLIFNIALVHLVGCTMTVLFYGAADKLPIGG